MHNETTQNKPTAFERFDASAAAQILYVLCDIDDTITTKGKLTAEAYTALWKLHDAQIHVIPVTGRSAGWCNMIIRQWPVKGVIGENGAFAFYWQDEKICTLVHPQADNTAHYLQELEKIILKQVPGCRVAHDQFSRRYDLAIDYCEDEPRLDLDAAKRILALCHASGAEARISSIHVNAWFGSYNKLDMTRLFFSRALNIPDARRFVLYFGDSPNDEPMFEYFPLSCAVENINPFLGELKALPAYVAKGQGGEGFSMAVSRLLALRD